MEPDGLELIEPNMSWRDAYLAMVDDYLAAGEERYRERRDLAAADFPALIRRWQDMARGENLGLDQIQQETWWLVRDGREILGTVYLRPQADAERQRKTGHVGYYVRPSERGKGYGTVALRLAVERLQAAGVTAVMVVCGKDNAASRRVAEKNGGVIAFERYSPTLQTWLSGYTMGLAGRQQGKDMS